MSIIVSLGHVLGFLTPEMYGGMGDHVAGEKKTVARNTSGPRISQRSRNDGRVSSLAGNISFLSLVQTQIHHTYISSCH